MLNQMQMAAQLYQGGDHARLLEYLCAIGMSEPHARELAEDKLTRPEPETLAQLLAKVGSNACTTTKVVRALGLQSTTKTPQNVHAWRMAAALGGFPVRIGPRYVVSGNTSPFLKARGGLEHVPFAKLLLGEPVGTPLSAALASVLPSTQGVRVARQIHEARCVEPNETIRALIAQTLRIARERGSLTLCGACCPDYEYVRTGNPSAPFKYTFAKVGDGVGLVAKALIETMVQLHTVFSEVVPVKIVVYMADTEVRGDGLCEKLGVTPEEFLSRCVRSTKAVQVALGERGIVAEVRMFHEHFGQRFDNHESQARKRMLVGDYGLIAHLTKDPNKLVRELAEKYRSFYVNWYGPMTDAEIERRIILQAADYAAYGKLLADEHDGCLQVAADRPDMQIFGAFYKHVSYLVRRRYYE